MYAVQGWVWKTGRAPSSRVETSQQSDSVGKSTYCLSWEAEFVPSAPPPPPRGRAIAVPLHFGSSLVSTDCSPFEEAHLFDSDNLFSIHGVLQGEWHAFSWINLLPKPSMPFDNSLCGFPLWVFTILTLLFLASVVLLLANCSSYWGVSTQGVVHVRVCVLKTSTWERFGTVLGSQHQLASKDFLLD